MNGLAKSLIKSLGWLIFMLSIGFTQVAITYFLGLLTNIEKVDYNSLIIDGFFVFLSISMVSTICFEFYFDHTIKSNKYLNIVIVLVSGALVVTSMIGYASIYLANNFAEAAGFNHRGYKTVQLWIFGISAILTYILKSSIYYNEYLKQLKNG